MNTRNLIVVVAALVAIIAVVAVIATSGNDTSEEEPEILDPTYDNTIGDLKVYGNANNDNVINDDDVKYIENAIVNKVPRTKFCDANHDGEINELDVEQVKNMIKRADGTKLWYIDGYLEDNSVEWPINSIVIIETTPSMHSVHAMTIAMGLSPSKVLAYCNDDPLLYAPYKGCNELKTNQVSNYDEVVRYGVPDVLLSGTRSVDKTAFDMYEKMKIDVMPCSGVNGDNAAAEALTFGYIFNCVEKSKNLHDFYVDLDKELTDKVSKIAEKDKKTGFIWVGAVAIGGQGYAQAEPMLKAGGINAADWPASEGIKKLSKDNSTWFYKYDPDFVWKVYPMGYNSTEDNAKKLYDQFGDIIDIMPVYKEGGYVLLESGVPALLQSAYMAEVMYPDLFAPGWADSWHQKLVDMYGLDYTCNGQSVTTLDEVHPAA